MRVLAEVDAALRDLTLLGRRRSPTGPAARGPALAWYPLVGLGLGAIAAAVAAALAPYAPGPAGPVGVALLALLSGQRSPGVLAGAAVRAVVAALLPPGALAAALLLAPMLGAWAVTVQCYRGGRRPAADAEEGVRRAGFREFGWASVTAFGVTLAVGDLVGLVVVVAAALVTVALRVVASRRASPTRRLLAVSRDVVETTTFVVLALLGVAARA
jgi:hypothetical protein